VVECGEVADHEHFRVPGDREVRLHQDAPSFVKRHAERPRERGGLDARGPEDRFRFNPRPKRLDDAVASSDCSDQNSR
jgi:hypothetical protein